jgi:hypothetical protein
MSEAQLNRMKSFGIMLLAIMTLGIFKSVYRRLCTPFKQLFLLLISSGYSFLIALALFCAIAHELKIITEHFQEMKTMLASPEFGYGIFIALYVSVWITLTASLNWYFNELTIVERTKQAHEKVSDWLLGLFKRAKKKRRSPKWK